MCDCTLIYTLMYFVCQDHLGMVQIHRDLTVFGSGRYNLARCYESW